MTVGIEWCIVLMVFAHVVEDFHLQGIMANMKQKAWWDRQIKDMSLQAADSTNVFGELDSKYGKDHIPVLLLHGFEWAVCISIPLIWIFGFTTPILVSLLINTGIHAAVDHLKCNSMKLNLIQDQALHIIQIVVTAIMIYSI